MIELPDLSTLSHEQKDALILFLFQLVQKQDQQIKLLTAKVAELEARLSLADLIAYHRPKDRLYVLRTEHTSSAVIPDFPIFCPLGSNKIKHLEKE